MRSSGVSWRGLGCRTANALEAARKFGGRDFAKRPEYMDAVAGARRLAPPGSRLPPWPRRRQSPEGVVRPMSWAAFRGCAGHLCEAYGEDARLLLITVTCRDDPGLSWGWRIKRVTARRDEVRRELKADQVWAASFFDVQRPAGGSDHFSPHWHILFATTAERMPMVDSKLKRLRSVALDVRRCDLEGERASARMRPEEQRRMSWMRTLAYCTKVWTPVSAGAPMPAPWQSVLEALWAEPGFLKRTGRDAVAARAAHLINGCKSRFHIRDGKLKVPGPIPIPRPLRVAAPRGRPKAVLDPAVLSRVERGETTVSSAARELGVDRKTVRARAAAPPDGR